ncbi:malate/lactate/ureidoglycolate dehydrogenase [Polaromonas aquatica]|uniref:malate/lactate/ureidoglycolate dehydrogenase n=1 Tax=Polaromonas aquatica TaxID=332657 RepID=UPI003D650A83
MQKVLQAQYLRAQTATILIAAGSTAAEAEKVAANLVMANLSGHDSHGIGMLPRYVDAVLEGGLTPNAQVKTLLDTGSLLSLNGQRGYGQSIGEQAMTLGMARAKTHGSCIIALAESHHLGRIGHFAEMAVAQGLVSLHFVNVMTRPVVAAWGGADGRYGTNPCCIGIPLKDQPPFILDFATSRVAQGKMRVAHNQGKSVQPGLLIDEHGQPTTTPGVVVVPQANGLFGALMPFGEHKGYGLAVACELLGGALTGGGTWHHPTVSGRAVYNSMLTILIDPGKLGTQSAMETEALAFVEWLRKSPPADGVDAVQIAGEPERRARLAREQDGIEIDGETWREIVAAGQKVGVDMQD